MIVQRRAAALLTSMQPVQAYAMSALPLLPLHAALTV